MWVHKEREEYLEDLPSEYPARVTNLIVPIALLLVTTVFFLWWTGREKTGSFLASLAAAGLVAAMMAGTLVTLILSALFFWRQGRIRLGILRSRPIHDNQNAR